MWLSLLTNVLCYGCRMDIVNNGCLGIARQLHQSVQPVKDAKILLYLRHLITAPPQSLGAFPLLLVSVSSLNNKSRHWKLPRSINTILVSIIVSQANLISSPTASVSTVSIAYLILFFLSLSRTISARHRGPLASIFRSTFQLVRCSLDFPSL